MSTTIRIQWCCSLLLFLTRSTHFRQIWSKNTKIASLSWNLAPTLIRICRIQWWCSLFLNLDRKYSFDQIGSKKSKLLFRLKFGIQTKSNIQNLMMVFTFFNLDRKYSFDQIGSKKSKLLFRLKFGTQTKSNIQNLMVVCI